MFSQAKGLLCDCRCLCVASMETFGRNLIGMKLAIDVRVLFSQVIFVDCKLLNCCLTPF